MCDHRSIRRQRAKFYFSNMIRVSWKIDNTDKQSNSAI